jgi:hypothetical protein
MNHTVALQKIKRLRQRDDTRYARRVRLDGAFLGDYNGVVETDRPHYAYVIKWNGEVEEVFNPSVPPIPGLRVWVGDDPLNPGLRQVLGICQAYSDPVYAPLAAHAETHQWPNLDTLYIRGEQIMPGMVSALSGMTVRVQGVLVVSPAGWAKGESADLDLSAYRPATGARWGVIELTSAGALQVTTGATVEAIESLTEAAIPLVNGRALAAVRLYENQGAILQSLYTSDIRDLRWGGQQIGASIEVDTSSFDGILSAADDTLQKALDTIDDHQHTVAFSEDLTSQIDGIVDTFALSLTPYFGEAAVYYNGVRQNHAAGHYAIAGVALTMGFIPAVGDTLYVDYLLTGTSLVIVAVEDAPNDGLPYVRVHGAWQQVVTGVLQLVPGTKSTTSATYVDVDATNAKISFVKQNASTQLIIDIGMSLYSTATNTGFLIGINDGTTDYDVINGFINPASSHSYPSGTIAIAGLAAGTYTLKLRWKRRSGSGTLTTGADDNISIRVEESA